MKHTNFKIIFIFIIFVFISILPSTTLPLGLRMFVVQSSSMKPSINPKSVVITKPNNNLSAGDVITFYEPHQSLPNFPTTTHRIEEIILDDNQEFYMTRGDNNHLSDPNFITKDKVVGKVIYTLPYIGVIIDIVKSKLGFLFFVCFPGFLILRNEILNIQGNVNKKKN